MGLSVLPLEGLHENGVNACTVPAVLYDQRQPGQVFNTSIRSQKIYFTLEACPGGYNLLMADSGNEKTYRWISSLSKRFSLVEMIATGIVYVKDNRTDTYQPFISENGKYCKYNKDLGKLTEL